MGMESGLGAVGVGSVIAQEASAKTMQSPKMRSKVRLNGCFISNCIPACIV